MAHGATEADEIRLELREQRRASQLQLYASSRRNRTSTAAAAAATAPPASASAAASPSSASAARQLSRLQLLQAVLQAPPTVEDGTEWGGEAWSGVCEARAPLYESRLADLERSPTLPTPKTPAWTRGTGTGTGVGAGTGTGRGTGTGTGGAGGPQQWSAGAGLECSACKRSLAEVGAYCRLQLPMGDLELGRFACACSLGRSCATLTASILQRTATSLQHAAAAAADAPAGRAPRSALACAELPSCAGCNLKNGRHWHGPAGNASASAAAAGDVVEHQQHRVAPPADAAWAGDSGEFNPWASKPQRAPAAGGDKGGGDAPLYEDINDPYAIAQANGDSVTVIDAAGIVPESEVNPNPNPNPSPNPNPNPNHSPNPNSSPNPSPSPNPNSNPNPRWSGRGARLPGRGRRRRRRRRLSWASRACRTASRARRRCPRA